MVGAQNAMFDVIGAEGEIADAAQNAAEKPQYLLDRVSDAQRDHAADDQHIEQVDPEGRFFFPALQRFEAETAQIGRTFDVILINCGTGHFLI